MKKGKRYQEAEKLVDRKKLYEHIKAKLVKGKKTYVFLDEIQNVPEFQKCVDSLFLREYLDIYITGSNSYMLSGELATYLTGRYIQIHVLPLSFKEYISYYGETDELKKYKDPDVRYYACVVDKNRAGAKPKVLFRLNLAYNVWEELGYLRLKSAQDDEN